jgi:hypothetical protein
MHAFGRDARHGPDRADRLQHREREADLFQNLAAGAVGGLVLVEHAGRGLEHVRPAAGMEDGRPKLPHEDGDPPLRIVGQDARGGAVILDLALDDLIARQADAQRQQAAPSLVQRLKVDELRSAGSVRAYRTSSLYNSVLMAKAASAPSAAATMAN